MGNLDHKALTRRRRPHVTSIDGILFVTFRLVNSIPKAIVRSYRAKVNWLRSQLEREPTYSSSKETAESSIWQTRLEELHREWFKKSEDILHRAEHGPNGSNHVHSVFKPFITDSEFLTLIRWDGVKPIDRYSGVSRIMHSLKGRTARECNLIVRRTGGFWEHESFDRVIRAGKFDNTVRYVLNNPVKAGLVDYWEDWRWNYCRGEIVDKFRKK